MSEDGIGQLEIMSSLTNKETLKINKSQLVISFLPADGLAMMGARSFTTIVIMIRKFEYNLYFHNSAWRVLMVNKTLSW